MTIIKQTDAGTPVPELCRERGMSSTRFYKWRSKYRGMGGCMMTWLKEILFHWLIILVSFPHSLKRHNPASKGALQHVK